MSFLKSLFGGCTGNLFGSSTDSPQCLILGLDQAGKTTLLYRLKLGTAWKKDVMKKQLEDMRLNKDGVVEDPGYHYEDINMGITRHGCGVWEVPGTAAMRPVWQAFYCAIKIHAVIFVVDGSDTNPERIATAKKLLQFLMNEDELRQSCFAVVINIRKEREKGTKAYDSKLEDQLHFKLGLHELHDSCEWRVEKFVINILELDGPNDQHWTPVRDWLKDKMQDPRGHNLNL